MSEKIRDINKIESLYKKGLISRTTLWRAKKRGYIEYGYHKVVVEGNPLVKSSFDYLYKMSLKTALKLCDVYLKESLRDNVKSVAHDIAHDVMLYLLEKEPNGSIKRLTGIVKQKVREYAYRKNIYYRYFTWSIKEYSLIEER